MADKKIIPINYTDRDYNSIRNALVQHAKRYYPKTFRDFNEASFGSLMLDTVAYVGDVLSFYLDYQANESFLETAGEYQNVLKLAKTMGYRFNKSPASQGECQFFCLVPSVGVTGEPDYDYAPIILKGSRVSRDDGGAFTLDEDVDFAEAGAEVVVAEVDETTGGPTYFAIKQTGRVISGEVKTHFESVGSFVKFPAIAIPSENISEIISVYDSEGREYFEVDHLSQELSFKPIINPNAARDGVVNIMKTVSVPRRFTVEHAQTETLLQFGSGTGFENVSGSMVDPSSVALKRHGRTHISDVTFDPTRLTNTDKMGVAPSNTVITVNYRENTDANANSSPNSINTVLRTFFRFKDVTSLSESILDYVRNSLEVTNEKAILGDVSLPTVEEIKIRALSAHKSQSRAVTRQDYANLAYAMPANFGSIKRVACLRDADSFKRNLNLYVISEDEAGTLVRTNDTIKRNLSVWLNHGRMVNDTVDIVDAFIVNIGIEFSIVVDDMNNKFDILTLANESVRRLFVIEKEIGEPLYLSEIYTTLSNIDGVVDVKSVNPVTKVGSPYSNISFDVDQNMTFDRRVLTTPPTHILEVKYPAVDISGRIE